MIEEFEKGELRMKMRMIMKIKDENEKSKMRNEKWEMIIKL